MLVKVLLSERTYPREGGNILAIMFSIALELKSCTTFIIILSRRWLCVPVEILSLEYFLRKIIAIQAQCLYVAKIII